MAELGACPLSALCALPSTSWNEAEARVKAEPGCGRTLEYLREQKGEWPPRARPGSPGRGLARPRSLVREKERRTAKERELGTYKEHKQTDALPLPSPPPAPAPPSPPPGAGTPALRAVLFSPSPPLQTAAPCAGQSRWRGAGRLGLLGGPLAEGSAVAQLHLSREDERPQPALTA